MTNVIQIKRSSVADSVPATGDLEYGELALNYEDGNLFYKTSGNAITLIASNKTATYTGNVTAGNLNTGGDVVATGNITADYFIGNGSSLTNIESFGTISVSGQSDVVANAIGATATFAAGDNIAITTDAATGTITFAYSTSDSTDPIFATGGDMLLITDTVTESLDLGSITDSVTLSYDLEFLYDSPQLFRLPNYTVGGLPAADTPGMMAFVTNDVGGAVPAFSDGTNWRRVTDRAVITT